MNFRKNNLHSKNKNKINHIAIIMDGNGRWAENKGKIRLLGHKEGVNTIYKIIDIIIEKKIKILTLYAFSSENWSRPSKEVNSLINLFINIFKNKIDFLYKKNIKLNIIGDINKFNKKLQYYIIKSQEITKNNTGLILNIALNYGGRWDITECLKNILKKIEDGILSKEEINESTIDNNICIKEYLPVDLVIRTGGEKRISNFLLWQIAYSELYFTDTLWPDFNKKEFDKALKDFFNRERKFGCIKK